MSSTTAANVRSLAIALNDAKIDARSDNWADLAAPIITDAVTVDPRVARRIARANDCPAFRAACAEAVLDLHRNHPGVLG